MSILCVIPVRGGSKGVPRKNIRDLAGRPLVAWSIRQALQARHDLDVVVSTEDPEIAEIARDNGAQVPFLRPAELAQDTTATEPVVLHALKHAMAAGQPPEAVVLLQATSPLRLPGTIDRAIEQFLSTGVDSMVGVVPLAPFLWRLDRDAVPQYDFMNRPRRQDLRDDQLQYRETGSLYITKPEIYLEHHNRLGGRIGLFVMDELEGVDIDTELDFTIAEQQMTAIQKQMPTHFEMEISV